MTPPFRLACVQVNAGNQMTVNIDSAAKSARAAREDGADFIAFPERVAMRERGRDAARAQAGASLLTVPSASTRPIGVAHWEILLRARAIENAAYVFAPAQCGEHPHGRLTHGHSLIDDPWGTVSADGGEAPGYIIAKIDPAKVEEVRRSLPSLTHDRDY